MMDCFDFSAQNTRKSPPPTSRVNLTPGEISRMNENRLVNLGSLVALSAKVLSISYKVDQVCLKYFFTSASHFDMHAFADLAKIYFS